ncbi:MAG: amidase, partial [Gammaproteobacteria bacterium]|nr:amidase [Gammaproteobacteria bacterium]
MDSDFAFLGLVELGKLIAQRKLSSLEVTNALMERIERIDPGLRSHVAVLRTSALKEARRADREIKQRKKRGPLHGVPVALKDLCDVKGVATTAGLPMFRKAIADRDATVTVKLRAAGAVVLGKLHLTEGALAQHHPDVPPPVNPWAKNRWSGAS